MKIVLLSGISMASLLLMSLRDQNLKKKNFIGIWDLISVENLASDNSVSYPYGEKPAGRMMIDSDDNYMVEIYTAKRTKIATGSKNTASPEENVMMVKGSNAHYGTFAVDVSAGTLLFKPEKAFFPNWEGLDLKSTFTIENEILKSFSCNTTFGGSKAIVTWKKRK